MVLNISPISDPEDIRREAGIASPPPTQAVEATEPQAVTQPNNPSVAPTDAAVAEQPTPPEPEIASTAAPSSFHIDEAPSVDVSAPTTTVAVETNAQAPEPVQSSPVVSSPSIYPDPQALKAQKQEHATFTESEAAGSYVYKMPVGVYIIASFAIALSLIFWVYVLILGARSAAFIIPGLGATIIATLLLGKDIIRWASVAATAAGTIYYGYYFIKAIGTYMDMSSVVSYGFGGLSNYFLSILLLYGAAVASMAVACWYLLRPNVAKAFK